MRLSVLTAAPLLMASTTLARSPLRRGQITDTCANLRADLVFSDVEIDGELFPFLFLDAEFQPDPGTPYDAGHIHVGLCISQVEMFVGHYNVTEAATKVVGVDKVKSAVTNMVNQLVLIQYAKCLLWPFKDQESGCAVLLPVARPARSLW